MIPPMQSPTWMPTRISTRPGSPSAPPSAASFSACSGAARASGRGGLGMPALANTDSGQAQQSATASQARPEPDLECLQYLGHGVHELKGQAPQALDGVGDPLVGH